MLAYRTTWLVKPGKMEEALELLRAEIERCNVEKGRIRVYTPDISPYVLVFEMDSESAQANDEFWAEHSQDPESSRLWQEWDELVGRRGAKPIKCTRGRSRAPGGVVFSYVTEDDNGTRLTGTKMW